MQVSLSISKVYPLLHTHSCDPTVLTHSTVQLFVGISSQEQLPLFVEHSSISEDKTEYYSMMHHIQYVPAQV